MNRRRFLRFGGFAGIAGIAGCAASAPTGDEGVVLTHVELGNATGTPQVFDVQVLHGDEIVHWAAHEVSAGDDGEAGGTVLEIGGSDDPGSVTVNVRVGSTWEGIDFDEYDEYDGERVIAVVTYGMVEDELRVRPHRSDRPTPAAGRQRLGQ